MKLRMTVVAALCIGLACGIAGAQAYAQGAGRITAYNPMGVPPPIQMKPMAERLSTLDGKTIYLVDTGFVGGSRLFELMTEWFQKNHPKATIVNRRASMSSITQDLRAEIIKSADAVLFGLGH